MSLEIPRILVVKLGALGDFIQALGPAQAIRRHHAEAAITLLTTAPFADLARSCPYFDAVWIDEKPRLLDPAGLLRLRGRLLGGGFSRVYDLQTSDRSGFYFWLMGPGKRPEWSGIARGASHPHRNPRRDFMHSLDRQAEQLHDAGITPVPPPDLSWIGADTARFGLAPGYVLLIPGGAAHRPEKRWPAAHYGALAARIAASGFIPVILGSTAEAPLAAVIREHCPKAADLTGKTGLADLAGLARGARHSIGNDTGPMHVAVAAGSPATILYSAASDPALTAPRGPGVTVLRRDKLADLAVDEVAATFRIR